MDEVNYQYEDIMVKSDYNRNPVESIIINENVVELNVGESVKLVTICAPSNASFTAVDWSSSDENIATVDIFGNVTKLADGETIITAATTDGSNLTATCKIVNPQARIEVEDIALNETDVTLNEGQTVQLQATVSPDDANNKEIVWTSSNDGIATVTQEGLVRAISKGVAVIVVTASDGSGVSASCEVTVHSLVSSVVLNETEVILNEGQTVQLQATVSPDDANNKKIVWTSSDENIATVSQDGLVTAVAEGNAVITVSSTDGSKVSAGCNIIVVKQNSGFIDGVTASYDGTYTVYNLQGIAILKTDDIKAIAQLPVGAYIVNGKKVIIR